MLIYFSQNKRYFSEMGFVVLLLYFYHPEISMNADLKNCDKIHNSSFKPVTPLGQKCKTCGQTTACGFGHTLVGRARIIQNIIMCISWNVINWNCITQNYFVYCMRILRSMTVKQTCAEADRFNVWKQNTSKAKKYRILTSLAAVIHENKRTASGSSEKVVNSWSRISFQPH